MHQRLGFLSSHRYLIHDRDGKFCPAFVDTVESVGVKTVKLPARSPNLNCFAEHWVRSAKEECLSKLILFGEASLRRPWPSSKRISTKNGLTKAKVT